MSIVKLPMKYVNSLHILVIGALLSPKILLGFIIMLKSLGVLYDETVIGIENFFKQNKNI